MLVAVTMVRDEEDVIGYTLSHLLAEEVDHIIVADNRSRDRTPDILNEFGAAGKVTVLVDDEVGYYQAEKMTRLAHMAWGMGADWVLPFDADELWYSEEGTVGEVLKNCDADVIQATEHKHWPTSNDHDCPNPFLAMPFKEATPNRLSKVAFKAGPNVELHMGNHDVDQAGQNRIGDLLQMRHFSYRSFEQFCRKVKNGREAYEATNLHGGYGTHWRTMGAMTPSELHTRWLEWYDQPGLVLDPAPVRG